MFKGKWCYNKPIPNGPFEITSMDNGGSAIRSVIVPGKYIDIKAATGTYGDLGEDDDFDEDNIPFFKAMVFSKPLLRLKWGQFRRYFPGSDASSRVWNKRDTFTSQLIHVKGSSYIHVSLNMVQFNTPDKDVIVDYYCDLGNSGVTYPFAIGKKYAYSFAMNDDDGGKYACEYVPLALLRKDSIAQIRNEFVIRGIASAEEMAKHFQAVELPDTVEEFHTRSREKTGVQTFTPYALFSYEAAWSFSKAFKDFCLELDKRYVKTLPSTRIFAPRVLDEEYPRPSTVQVLPEERALKKIRDIETYYS